MSSEFLTFFRVIIIIREFKNDFLFALVNGIDGHQDYSWETETSGMSRFGRACYQ